MSRFSYLATPYSKYPGGLDAAWNDACCAAAALLRAGVPVYSPIAHTHPIAINGGIDPLDHAFWLKTDEAMMDAADELIVVMMPGFAESAGILHEVAYFTSAGKTVRYVAWPDILTGPPPAQPTTDTRLVP